MNDNLLEYDDPVLYDLENADFEPDGPFFLSLARELGGPVLEMGCGTGRVTIPLAQAGIPITGLDLVPRMLERARQKAGDSPIEWIEGDVCDFHLGRQFNLIFETGAVFRHLLERADQEAMLGCVREHLAPEGRYVCGFPLPVPKGLLAEETEKEWYTYTDEQGREVRVSGTFMYDPLRQVTTETAYRRWKDADGNEQVRVVPLSLRVTFPQEMEALLAALSFKIIDRYGNLDRSPLTTGSPLMIFVCGKAA